MPQINVLSVKLDQIDLEKLPKSEPIDVFTMRATIERGVRNAIKPWDLAKENPDMSTTTLQKQHDDLVKQATDSIMEVVIYEHYIKE